MLASGRNDRRVQLWDTETSELKGTVLGNTGWYRGIAFKPDSTMFATVSYRDRVVLWDTQTGKFKGTLTGHTERVVSVVFSPDGETLAGGSHDGNSVVVGWCYRCT